VAKEPSHRGFSKIPPRKERRGPDVGFWLICMDKSKKGSRRERDLDTKERKSDQAKTSSGKWSLKK